jgi:(p)ppGpp synthase/HD superfamily hydrolase
MALISERFQQALVYASQLHQHQVRKGSTIPYVSHLSGVTALVLEDGDDEDQAIASQVTEAHRRFTT